MGSVKPYGDFNRCDYCTAPAVVDLIAQRRDGVIEEAALCERHYRHLACYLGAVRWEAQQEREREPNWKVA